jgi:hypothetical protein
MGIGFGRSGSVLRGCWLRAMYHGRAAMGSIANIAKIAKIANIGSLAMGNRPKSLNVSRPKQ